MYTTIICEKPSVAASYVDALDMFTSTKCDGYTDGISSITKVHYRVTYSFGHLVTMSYPEKYDQRLAKWDINTLPFLPKSYKYEVIKDVRKQFNVIKELYHDPECECILYAGDSGREGIYIQMLIRQEAGVRPGIDEKVVWISSQTKDEILRGIREAKPVSEYKNLIDAAYMRAIEDYSMGINFSRALTYKFGYEYNKKIVTAKYRPIAVGRVMTCVLGMIVDREKEITNFKETVFYRIAALCGTFEANWKATEGSKYYGSPLVYNNEGFLDYSNATAFMGELSANPTLLVSSLERKTEKKNPPLLYNLAEIQSDCSKKLHLSPDETLEIIQGLYEAKLVTYPRTDARVLSTAVADEIENNIAGLKSLGIFPDIMDDILNKKRFEGLSKTRYCDDSKITDHYAIIPTGQGDVSRLKGTDVEVYELILRRFLSIFFPAAEYKKTSVELTHTDSKEKFYVNEKILVSPGYLEIAGYEEKPNAEVLGTIKEGDTFNPQYTVREGKTTPPKRYTSGSMILAMENAGNLIEDEELRAQIKGSGIGTSATRAEIIKKLCSIGMISLEKKTQMLKPMTAGEIVYEIVNKTISSLLSPKMTASWEKGLSQIEDGTISRDEYQQKLNTFIFKNTELIKQVEAEERPEDGPAEPTGLKCPVCGGALLKTSHGLYRCNGVDYGTCKFRINEIAGRKLMENEVEMLLTNGRINNVTGFLSKNGRPFTANLVYNPDEGKVSLDFPEIEYTETSLSCPKCNKPIKKDQKNYTCPDCKMRVPLVLCGRAITEAEADKIFREKKSDMLYGFTGSKGMFNAYLRMKKDGSCEFEFEKKRKK